MSPARLLTCLLAAAATAGCATINEYARIDRCLAGGRAWDYAGARCTPSPPPQVDALYVDKSERRLSAYRRGELVRTFRVALGRGGLLPKERQGDGRVPEGRYLITTRNPNSAYHLSLRIGYPTPDQAATAARLGIAPGGEIMIHGLPNGRGTIGSRHSLADWTEGCIALTNPEIEWLYRAVPDGTPIEITA
ncbi:MAG: ErfK/YbiS/YcfS/YnhG family protein [uncultured Sphingomonas sp.]|uniref:ErfK/YbiS/YcfS/YnhG family protein n=1 Tax=uncultured Sphingomonas sp. TaxID=158754 RepID=A0A6J4SGX9_9SPHN|nr:L,D-transpeptidase family protein [uncultured Sphingomonas sp.]CAA9499102.1 MAG: ErfK/YbiS/YcfS/YnhG family protein [uncultured Sphingomonas sp.]